MSSLHNTTKVTSRDLDVSVSAIDGQTTIKAIFGDADLKKTIFSLVKTFGGFLNTAVVNKVVSDIGKVTLGVPFVGVGVQALVLIMNNVAVIEENKEKSNEITTYAKFLEKHLREIDNEDNEAMLQESVIRILSNAWILQENQKEREGYAKRAWNCVRGCVCAQSIAGTLEHVARELQQIQNNLNTILILQANNRELHFLKGVDLEYDQSFYKVGLQTRIDDIMKRIEGKKTGNKLQAIGVFGIGGIGKTTLLHGLYNHLARKGNEYIVALLLLNENSTVMQVQENLVKQITSCAIEFHHEGEGQSYIATTLKRLKQKKKVCLIFDNLQITKSNMVSKILPDPTIIRENVTFLIVSARERENVHQACLSFATSNDDIMLYEPPLLKNDEDKTLFCKRAKIENNIAPHWVDAIVPLLGGLPLALEVYGSYFADERKRKPEEWSKVLKKLQKAEDTMIDDVEGKVFKKIEMSLNLYKQENQIQLTDFMDAALFWKDKPWEEAKLALLWEENEDGLSRLKEKSLAGNKSNYDGLLYMHDILVSVAKRMAEDDKYMYYQVTQDNPSPIKQNQEERIRGIVCKDVEIDSASSMQKMDSLKFIDMDNCHLDVPTSIMAPRWIIFTLFLYLAIVVPILSPFLSKHLSFYACFSLFIITPTLILILLYLFHSYILPSSMLIRKGNQFLPQSLTYLRVHDCFGTICLSHSIENLTQLRSLNLTKNHGIENSLPPSIFSKLGKLHLLNLSRCADLAKIPTSFSNLTSLRTLDLSFCSVLKDLPRSLGELKALESINLSNCHLLSCLPDSIEQLTQLQCLNMSNCDALSYLPSSFGNLKSLKMLDLSLNDKLEWLPPSFPKLHALEHLNMSKCSKVKNLPNDFGDLGNLQYLNISQCSSLIGLPGSISKLKHLQNLDASHCYSLQEVEPTIFEHLRGTLTNLDLTACNKLKIDFELLNKDGKWKHDS